MFLRCAFLVALGFVLTPFPAEPVRAGDDPISWVPQKGMHLVPEGAKQTLSHAAGAG